MTRTVLVLGFPWVQSLDVTGPADVFTTASIALRDQGSPVTYDLRLVSQHGQPIDTGVGLQFGAHPLPDPAEPVDTLLLPGGTGVHRAVDDADLIEWIRVAATRARRVISVCNGAFLAAEAGLLDGRRAATHWAMAEHLAERYPTVQVDAEALFVRSSDHVWTSAGVTAGIDLALAVVEEDHGTELAQLVARWLVLYMRRPGGQSQFAPPVWMPRARRDVIREAQQRIEAEPGLPHRLPDLAQEAAMSPRHFSRVFTEETGEPPSDYIERVRTEAARRALTESSDTMPVIAARCGFGSSESMRRTFVRRLGVSPITIARPFADTAASSPNRQAYP
ncbi:GlxA family transcriptional regulator [Gordonia rubripertincta]|nr:GlxA family transcriptional regulator [Gordonia rubripertincta]MDG6782311.1 GlxA family transcriptional regulator [Gordonia rubripertincta]NKY65878.1 GlxA family transcriptional regulator [Gordonia rubripertincta]